MFVWVLNAPLNLTDILMEMRVTNHLQMGQGIQE